MTAVFKTKASRLIMERIVSKKTTFFTVSTYLTEYDLIELCCVNKSVLEAVQSDLRLQNRILVFKCKRQKKELEVA